MTAKRGKRQPLATRLRAAQTLLRQWRRAVLDSNRCREEGPNYGKVDEATAHELARFDRAIESIGEAVKLFAGEKEKS